MSELHNYTEMNHRAWDEIAEVRSKMQQPAQFFREGGSTLDARELEAAGNIRGNTLLHLQCATGEDTLSWTQVGALATGVDISKTQIELAQQKAAESRLPTRFVSADIYALPPDLQQQSFDYVYTGKGVLTWLPDLTEWARVIIATLKPSGRFILFEEHPVAQCMFADEKGQVLVNADYFARQRPYYDTGWSHFQGGEQAQEQKAEFIWPLGDIVTTLVEAGMHIERLQEYPSNAAWRFGEHLEYIVRLPGQFLLTAHAR